VRLACCLKTQHEGKGIHGSRTFEKRWVRSRLQRVGGASTLIAMLGIDRRVLSGAWTLFLFVLVLVGLYEISHTLVIFALALFLANLLSPVVELVQRAFPRGMSRPLALAVVYLALLGILSSAAIFVGSRIAEQATGLARRLPQAIEEDPFARLPLPGWLEPARAKVSQAIRDRMDTLDKDVLPMLSDAGRQVLTGVGSALSLILVPILSFFFLKDGLAMRGAIVELFSSDRQVVVNEILVDLQKLLAQYIRALVLLSIASFIATLGFLSVTGAPYALLLAGIAALLEFIPVVGPLTAGTVIVLVAAFSSYPHVLWLVAFLVVYRIFQDYVLNPYLMSAGVELHPVLVLFGVIAGEQLAGIPGMFFSVPLMAALRVVLTKMRRWDSVR
jgi:predicted PurR-regulated permease PerM